jgi:formiminotetrahydrofolate cyclodeaminase
MEGFESYTDALASARPVPGGGSAATIVGALAAALVAMVARITAANPRHAPVAERAREVVERADSLRAQLGANRLADELAYGAVVDAQKLPKATDNERRERTSRLQVAFAGAAAAPLRTAELARELLSLAAEAGALGNEHLASDVDCASEFARAALRAAALNVRANHPYLHDRALVERNDAALERLLAGL